MTSILVTGGAGYIGSHTCKALRRAGFAPVVYDDLSRGNPEAVKWGELVTGELADRVLLRETLRRCRPAAVVHFAAYAYVGESTENPALYYRNNVGGTSELVSAMHDCGVRHIVFSSSCTVYGVPRVLPIGEDIALDPVSPYGATKAACERMLRDCAAAGTLSFMALRYFNAAGADPDGEIGECHVPETHAIPLILDAAAGEIPAFTIFGDDYPTADGTCIRDYIHVSDLADAHVRAVNALLDGGESAALNIGTGRGWSVRELIDIARKVTGREIPALVGARRPGDPPALVSDPARARARLGWAPRFADAVEQIAHAWHWHQGGRQAFERARNADPGTAAQPSPMRR